MINYVDGEIKNWERGFKGSTFLSFFCFDFEICGICFSTSENITGGSRSILLIFNGFGLTFYPAIYFKGINN